MNVKALIVQAAALANSAEYTQLEILCHKILKKKPKCFDALQLLGLAQVELGQIEDAIKTLERSCEMDESHAGVRINLANSYLRDKRAEDSLRLGEEAVALDPAKFESHLVLGNALLFSKNYVKAEVAYTNVLRINPESLEARDYLAECVKRQGRLHEAIALRFKVNEICPAYTPVYVNLVNVLMYAGCREEALEVANIGLQVEGIAIKEVFDLWIGIARYGWLTGNIMLMAEALENSRGIHKAGDEIGDLVNLSAYHIYMTKLFQTFDNAAPFYNRDYDACLYFIAESHSLSASNVVVSYAGKSCKIESLLILGCKVWFLNSLEMNEFRASLALLMASLPRGANIVLGFGEIDCRANEGILIAFRQKSIDYKLLIPVMIASYIEYALSLAEPRLQKVLIYGVPAPNLDLLSDVDDVTQVLLIDIVRLFNKALKDEAGKNKLSFIDVYSATANSGGQSNMKYHLDGYHLNPSVYPLLFDEYVVELASPEKTVC